jgi:lactoylglutathione lyase
MELRAFPVLYARDVEGLAAFYECLGFAVQSRVPGTDGQVGYIGLRRGVSELAVTTEQSPELLAGVLPGPGPRHELFVYVDDLDASIEDAAHAGAQVLRGPNQMPWGERLAYLRDPEGNLVALAQGTPRKTSEEPLEGIVERHS